MELAIVSNEAQSVTCPAFFGFGPLNFLMFTLLHESQPLEHNMTVETCGTNPLSLFIDYISKLSWIMVVTRHFLILHACWTCGLFGESHCTGFESIYHAKFFLLEPQGLGAQAAQASTYQLGSMRTCLILRGGMLGS